MTKIEKRSDLYREYARVIDMVEGTNINVFSCVKWNGIEIQKETATNKEMFANNINSYQFAIAIVEEKPVFLGDVLYDKQGSIVRIDKKSSFDGGELYTVFFGVHDVSDLSWNPPKPKTFNLNGVELPIYNGVSMDSTIFSTIHSSARITLDFIGLKEDDIKLIIDTFKNNL